MPAALRRAAPVSSAGVAPKTYNVLFLCTGNSARSILAEVLLDHWGKGRFKGYSAGSFPRGAVHPLALDLLDEIAFADRRAAQQELGRIRPAGRAGNGFRLHRLRPGGGRGLSGLAGQPGDRALGRARSGRRAGTEAERRRAFREAYLMLETRIKLFVALPIDKLDRMAMKRRVDQIGRRIAADTEELS